MCISIKLINARYVWCSQLVKVCYTVWFFTAYTLHIVHAYSPRYPTFSVYDHLNR